MLENLKEQAENAASAGGSAEQGDPNDLLSSILSSLAGSSEEGTGETSPVGGSPAASESKTATGSQRATTAALASGSASEDQENQETESGAAENTSVKDSEDTNEKGAEALSEGNAGNGAGSEQNEAGSAEILSGGANSPQAHQTVSDQEGGRIPLQDTSEVSAPEGGSTERDDNYEGTGYTGSAADIERLLNRIAEDSVTTELERQRTEELTELAQSISYGDIHDGVSKTVHRIASVSDEMKEEYRSIAGDLLHISKQLQKSVLQQMQDSRRGGKQTSLLMGRRLDAHALFRTDSRVFYKNALPNEMPALCVGLLLDESGSMSWNDRATYARATAIILYDFCQALGIPITVYGHSTSRGVDPVSYTHLPHTGH